MILFHIKYITDATGFVNIIAAIELIYLLLSQLFWARSACVCCHSNSLFISLALLFRFRVSLACSRVRKIEVLFLSFVVFHVVWTSSRSRSSVVRLGWISGAPLCRRCVSSCPRLLFPLITRKCLQEFRLKV